MGRRRRTVQVGDVPQSAVGRCDRPCVRVVVLRRRVLVLLLVLLLVFACSVGSVVGVASIGRRILRAHVARHALQATAGLLTRDSGREWRNWNSEQFCEILPPASSSSSPAAATLGCGSPRSKTPPPRPNSRRYLRPGLGSNAAHSPLLPIQAEISPESRNSLRFRDRARLRFCRSSSLVTLGNIGRPRQHVPHRYSRHMQSCDICS